jgi:nucleoside-diphosphate-sugar epimerase
MKLILTGGTGFIGAEVLRQALIHPAVTEVVALTRRPLPSSITSSKLKSLVVEDFTSYSEPVQQELSEAKACIWAMGTVPSKSKREVDVDYPLAALHALSAMLQEKGADKTSKDRLRFIYLSGMAAERDKGKGLWWLGGPRKLKVCTSNIGRPLELQRRRHESFYSG